MMKYKALNKEYPPTVKFPDNTIFVDEQCFINIECDGIPLFVGTQFGVYPYDYSNFQDFHGQRIAIIGKSLLSGIQVGITKYIVDNGKIIKIT